MNSQINRVSKLRLIKFHVFFRVLIYIILLIFGLLTCADPARVWLFIPAGLMYIFLASKIRTQRFCALDMALLCYFLYFVVAPMQRVDADGIVGTTLNGAPVTLGSLVQAAYLPFVLVAAIVCARKASSFFNWDRRSCLSLDLNSSRMGSFKYVLFGVGLAAICGYIITKGGFAEVMRPRRLKSSDGGVSIFPALFLGFALVSNLVLLIRGKFAKEARLLEGRTELLLWTVQSLFLLIIVNPFNTPRYINVAVWLPIAMVFFGKFARPKYVYTGLLVGLLVLMPALSLTSRRGLEGADMIDKENYFADIFRIKDVDVYDTLAYSIDYPKEHGFGYGRNVGAIVLFFVPRSVWSTKPVVAGLEIGEELKMIYDVGTSNLSFFPGGDLYLDFGWTGVILGGVILGFLSVCITLPDMRINSLSLFDVIVCGSIPILLRGPLGAVCGYFVATTIAFFIIMFFLRTKGFKIRRFKAA